MEDTNAHAAAASGDQRKSKDLVTKMHELLQHRGAPIAQNFRKLHYVAAAEGKSDEEQRRLINKQLRLELGQLPQNTSVARLTLDDTCSMNDYLTNFKRYALPVLAPHS